MEFHVPAQIRLDRRRMHGLRRRQVRHHDATVPGDAGEFRRMDPVDEHESGRRFLEMESLDIGAHDTSSRARGLEGHLGQRRQVGEAPLLVADRGDGQNADAVDGLGAQLVEPSQRARRQLRLSGQQAIEVTRGKSGGGAQSLCPYACGWRCCDCRSRCPVLGADPVVPARLQLEREVLAAGLDDAARIHHVHVVGHDVVEQTLVVRDQDDRVVLRGELVDAAGDDPQRVDVEAGIGLVEDREPRLEQRHLQDFVALLLAAREAFVDAAVEKIGAHLEQLHLLAHVVVELERVELVLAALRLHGVVGETQELAVGDAGNLDRVLKTEEYAGTRTLLGLQLEQVLALVEDRAAGHHVGGMPGERLGERALARAVRPHDARALRRF